MSALPKKVTERLHSVSAFQEADDATHNLRRAQPEQNDYRCYIFVGTSHPPHCITERYGNRVEKRLTRWR
jgi:hypothetical protein